MLSHDCVIKFFGHRRSGLTEYLFLEYASGGELFDRIGNMMPHCLSFSFVVIINIIGYFFGVKMLIALKKVTLKLTRQKMFIETRVVHKSAVTHRPL